MTRTPVKKSKAKRGRPKSSDTDSGLTPRETKILHELRDGKTYAAIAQKFFRSPETIRTHVHRIYVKLEVKNRIQAINKFFGKN